MAELRERLAAQERLAADAMRQLVVAKQLLQDVHSKEERERIAQAEADVRRYHAAALAKGREVELLHARLSGTEQQLAYAERQLAVLVEHTGAKAAAQAAAAGNSSPSRLGTPALSSRLPQQHQGSSSRGRWRRRRLSSCAGCLCSKRSG